MTRTGRQRFEFFAVRECYSITSSAASLAGRRLALEDAASVDACQMPRFRIIASTANDRNRRCRSFGRQRRGRAASCDDGHLAVDQIGRQRRQPIALALRKVKYEVNTALEIAGFTQSLAERTHTVCKKLGRFPDGFAEENAYHWERKIARHEPRRSAWT